MENTSNTLYRDLYPKLAMLNNNVSCRNLADNNSLMDAKCDNLSNQLSQDTTPVIIAIVITALYSIVCVVGLVGNVLVMYVIIR